MQCSKCKKENIKKANYCQGCGRKFSEEEKEKARNTGIIGKIRHWEEVIDGNPIKRFFDNPVVKAIPIIALLAFGFYNIYKMGSDLTILKGDDYEITYNSDKDEYYVVTKEPPLDGKVYLNMYIPNKIDKLTVSHFDENGSLLESVDKDKKDEIVLNANTTENLYYTITDNLEEPITYKVYIYYGGL